MASPSEDPDLQVLCVDPCFVVADKPAGMVFHRDENNREDPAVLQSVRDAIGARVYPVQRLDKATSGLVILARSSGAAARLQQAMAAAHKEYAALVRWRRRDGAIAPWTNRTPLPNKRENLVEARTDFEMLECHGRVALLRCVLWTGRYHQIRRHLAAEQRFCLGDPYYGPRRLVPWSERRLGLRRMFLHHHRLRLRHPDSGVELEFESALPPTLCAALEAARAHAAATPTARG